MGISERKHVWRSTASFFQDGFKHELTVNIFLDLFVAVVPSHFFRDYQCFPNIHVEDVKKDLSATTSETTSAPRTFTLTTLKWTSQPLLLGPLVLPELNDKMLNQLSKTLIQQQLQVQHFTLDKDFPATTSGTTSASRAFMLTTLKWTSHPLLLGPLVLSEHSC